MCMNNTQQYGLAGCCVEDWLSLKHLYLHVMGLIRMHMLLYLFMPAVSYSCEIFLGYSAPSILNLRILFDIDVFFSSHNSNDFLRKIIDMEMATTAFVIPLSFIYHIFNKHLLSIYYLLVSARDIKIMKFISVLKESQSTNKHRHAK